MRYKKELKTGKVFYLLHLAFEDHEHEVPPNQSGFSLW